MCFTCILVCVCVCVCAWMLVLYVYMYVCMHACLCSYGVYKNLHLTHLLYTAVSFYFFMSFCFFLVFILSSVCFFRSLVYRFVIVVISIVVVIFTPRNMKKEFELSFAISWLFSLALFLRVCVYVCKLEHVVTNLSVSQLVCMSVEKPFKACYCCFIFFLCCFFSHASVSILAFGWYQMREYFCCCCCCFYEFVIYK